MKNIVKIFCIHFNFYDDLGLFGNFPLSKLKHFLFLLVSIDRLWYYTFTRLVHQVQHVVYLMVTRPSLSSSLDRHHLFIYFLGGAYQMKFPSSTWKLPKNVAGNLRPANLLMWYASFIHDQDLLFNLRELRTENY